MKKSKSTMVELVEELQKLPQTPEIIEMIAEAKAGEYHDYKNQKYTCGKVESYNRLSALGHKELADRIRDGEFDEEADADDVEELKKSAPPEMHEALGLGDKRTPSEKFVDGVLKSQRNQASSIIMQMAKMAKDKNDLANMIFEVQVHCTHMLALLIFNNVKNETCDLKTGLERMKKNIMTELDWLSEADIVMVKPEGKTNG